MADANATQDASREEAVLANGSRLAVVSSCPTASHPRTRFDHAFLTSQWRKETAP
jgi:hypothetical protein